jgi:hypothetical protein
MTMPVRSNLIVFLLLGLLVGAVSGYMTRPESAEIKLGPLSIEVKGNQVAHDNGPLTSSQVQHIALITLIGGVTLARGTNVVNGARLVIDMNTGRATVDGNAVAGGTTAASGGRVTGHFTVPKRAASTTPPASGSTPPK